MRLWHYELIRALPDKQLLSQWRELCAIASRINKIGYPNHALVNKLIFYSYKEFLDYSERVVEEMYHRKFKINMRVYDTLYQNILNNRDKFHAVRESICGQYKGWHTKRYYWQCYRNLQEKYDCDAISKEEWEKIEDNAKFVRRNKYAAEKIKILL